MKLYRSTLAQVRDGSGARCAVDHGQFAHHRPEAEDSKDSSGGRKGSHSEL